MIYETTLDPYVYCLWNFKVHDMECICSSYELACLKMQEIISDSDFKDTDFGIKRMFLYND